MARLIRLPLLLVMLGLTIVFVLTPTPAFAGSPHCEDTEGHFSGVNPICGNTSSECNPYYSVYGVVGTQHYEWDCVVQEGSMTIQNVVFHSPEFCYCSYGRPMLCSGDWGSGAGPCSY